MGGALRVPSPSGDGMRGGDGGTYCPLEEADPEHPAQGGCSVITMGFGSTGCYSRRQQCKVKRKHIVQGCPPSFYTINIIATGLLQLGYSGHSQLVSH